MKCKAKRKKYAEKLHDNIVMFCPGVYVKVIMIFTIQFPLYYSSILSLWLNSAVQNTITSQQEIILNF